MSVCRQICRKALRGCLRVPGCKPVCYICLRPVCYGVSDSEDDDDDSDKEDGRFFRNAHHIQDPPPEDIALREQGATETSAVVEYYNDTSCLTPPPWQIDKSPSKDENRGYTNVMGAEDMCALQSISNVEYNMCVSDDHRSPPSHEYVNMSDDFCDVRDNDTDVLTNSSHRYHNIDQVCMTSETRGSRSHLDALLIRNQEQTLNTTTNICPNSIVFREKVCNGTEKLNDEKCEDGPILQYCSLESIDKTEYRDLPTIDTSHMVRDTGLSGSRHSLGGDQCVVRDTGRSGSRHSLGGDQCVVRGTGLSGSRHSLGGDKCVDKVCPDGDQDFVVKSTDTDQVVDLTGGLACRSDSHNNNESLVTDETTSVSADGASKSFGGEEVRTTVSLKVDDNKSSCCVDDRISSSIKCTDDQTNDQVDTVNDSTNLVSGHVDDSNHASTSGVSNGYVGDSNHTSNSGVPNGHVDSDDVSFEANFDKSQTLIMLETDL